MDYDEIFAAYYAQYRAEADTPNSSDDEYKIGIPLANEAINRWSNYDNTMWQGLFQTLQRSGDGDLTITSGTTEYATPGDMKLAGGKIRIFDSANNTIARVKIINPEDEQFQPDSATFAYFIGDPNNGFTLVFSKIDTTWIGKSINYVYYRKPTLIEDGTTVVDMSDPYFIVHRMLANRFRSSRNPYYTSAKSDAEDALRTMQLQNNSGTWANPWTLPDNSGSEWGM